MIPVLDDDDPALLPKLTDQQMELLARHGKVRPIQVGDVLFRAGDAAYDVMVLLAGTVAVAVDRGGTERDLAIPQSVGVAVEVRPYDLDSKPGPLDRLAPAEQRRQNKVAENQFATEAGLACSPWATCDPGRRRWCPAVSEAGMAVRFVAEHLARTTRPLKRAG